MAVTASSIGVPFPGVVSKSAADRFPCEHCACGCANAEACWRSCCCYTNREKLAWARRNSVTAPMFVVAAARRERCPKCTMASHRGEHACHNSASCHEITGHVKPCCAKPLTARAKRYGGNVVMLVTALRCRGISVSVAVLPPALPLGGTLSATAIEPWPQDLLVLAASYEPPSFDIASPPPQAALA